MVRMRIRLFRLVLVDRQSRFWLQVCCLIFGIMFLYRCIMMQVMDRRVRSIFRKCLEEVRVGSIYRYCVERVRERFNIFIFIFFKCFLGVFFIFLFVVCVVVYLYRDIVLGVGQQIYDQGLFYLFIEVGLSGLVFVFIIL